MSDNDAWQNNKSPAPADDAWGSRRSPSPRDRSPPPRRSRSRSPPPRRDDDFRGRTQESGGPGSVNPGNNLHVSGLSVKVDSRELEAHFAGIGKIQKAQVMYDPHTRESRGFGFVTFEEPGDAERAIQELNATELMGRTINVEKARRARARTPTPGKYFGPPKREDSYRPYNPRPDYGRGGYGDRYDRGGYGDRYDRGPPRYDDRSAAPAAPPTSSYPPDDRYGTRYRDYPPPPPRDYYRDDYRRDYDMPPRDIAARPMRDERDRYDRRY